MSIDTIPPELLAEILSIASLDGGPTASFLALVSKYVAAVARPYRYRSVALAGPIQIMAFLSRCRELHGSGLKTPLVHHLFVSDRRPNEAYEAYGLTPASAPWTAWEELQTLRKSAATFNSLCDELFEFVKPSLQTLTLISINPCQSSILHLLERFTFDRLTDCSLRLARDSWYLERGLSMPQLSRLHVSCHFDDEHLDGYTQPYRASVAAGEMLATLPSTCPALSRIRFSDVRFEHQGVAAWLGHMFGFEGSKLETDAYIPEESLLSRFAYIPLKGGRIIVQPRLCRASAREDAIHAELAFFKRLVTSTSRVDRDDVDPRDLPSVLVLNELTDTHYEDWKEEWMKKQEMTAVEREEYMEEARRTKSCLSHLDKPSPWRAERDRLSQWAQRQSRPRRPE